MIFNLLFTGSGLWLKQQSFHYSTNCSDTFIHILAARWKEELVLWSGVACYLAVGVICCCCLVGWGTRKRWCRNILVLLAGALYLVGDNLGLVDNCFDFLHRCLLGLSLALAIAPNAIRYLKGGLGENRGCAQQGLIHPCEMAVNTLYPMLMFTVHIDQTYTAIVGDVSHHKQAFQNGTKCPIVHVYVSIVFFILICIIWGGVVRTVADKYHKYICKFKEANPETDTKWYIITLLFQYVVIFYTPGYVALDNLAPWICVTNFHSQGDSTVHGEMTTYVNVRGSLLVVLGAFTFLLTIVYICCRVKVQWLKRGQDDDPERARLTLSV